MSGGFEHLGDTVLHRWSVLQLARARFREPDGGEFSRMVVRSRGAVAVVPLLVVDGEPSVVLVRQYRPAIGAPMWEIPAGMRDVEGEPPEATAARELEEEAGYRASRLVGLGVFHPLVGLSDSTHHLFAALDLVPVPPRRESVEERHLEVAVVGLDEAFAMMERGELTDGKTVIGLYRVRERLGSLLGAP